MSRRMLLGLQQFSPAKWGAGGSTSWMQGSRKGAVCAGVRRRPYLTQPAAARQCCGLQSQYPM